FYNDAVNDQLEIKEDFPNFKDKKGFSFCDYPFMLNPAVKADVLKVESVFQMRHELQDAFFRALFQGVNSPYLVLEIRRDHIISDTLLQLEEKSIHDLKKQLRVQFVGEEGVDEGGVQKEFFQLIVREIFDPKYGMFTFNEESRLCWFTPNPVLDEINIREYKLVGLLLGLAVYNSVILDLHFPLVLYKKLMQVNTTLSDLKQLDPSLGKGLERLLNFEGDIVTEYDRNFQVDIQSFGHVYTCDLKPFGSNIQLTNENKHEFVDLYVQFVLTDCIEKQFNAFKEGFQLVCQDSAIKIFRPEEVEQLICGSSDLDFDALEASTVYDGGWSKDSDIIKYFWEIVHSFTYEEKKKLLFFATGSDRAPIGGLGKLQFVIAKNGGDSDRLPTSHTCYNVLLLCEYSSKEKLKERLLTSISNAEGFDHYFTKRKQRLSQPAQKTKEATNHVVQAPEPVYEITKKAPKQIIKKNSILYYLSQPRTRDEKKEEQEEQQQCQIRMSLPLSDIWHAVLEEFDASSITPAFTPILPQPSSSLLPLANSRKRQTLEDNDGTRNVRLRLHANPVTWCLEEDLQETDEDLSRPTRNRYSLETTQLYLLAVTREFSDDLWC
ncbi:Ubiquitin-protein ligase E3A, partial [Choanephora cucurbitarum]